MWKYVTNPKIIEILWEKYQENSTITPADVRGALLFAGVVPQRELSKVGMISREERNTIRQVVGAINKAGADSRAFAGGLQTFHWLLEQWVEDSELPPEVQEHLTDRRLVVVLWAKYQKDGGLRLQDVLDAIPKEEQDE